MRLIFFLFWALLGALVHASDAALHKEDSLARGGCLAVLDTFGLMLRQPPDEAVRRRVKVTSETGAVRQVPYTHTENFVNDSLRHVCSSAGLAQYRRTTTVLGEALWRRDHAPDYANVRRIHADLVTICNRLVRRHRAAMVLALEQGDAGAALREACEGICGPRPQPRERMTLAARRLLGSPRVVLRLLPLLALAASLPYVIRPFFRGVPPLPEPLGPPTSTHQQTTAHEHEQQPQ